MRLVTDEGILREMKPEIDDSNDGVQFKGIFIRHLAFLYEVTKNPAYKDFILKNAESIITKDYDPTSKASVVIGTALSTRKARQQTLALWSA